MFLALKFSRKTFKLKAIKFQKRFCVILLQKFVTGIIWNKLGLFNYKRMKRNLHFRKNPVIISGKLRHGSETV